MKNQSVSSIGFALLILILFLTAAMRNKYKTISSGESDKIIKIGDQVWMTQNLDVATFRNGDTIAHARTAAEWRTAYSKKQPAWCYYNNDSTNGAVYGKLYNWSAVNDNRGLAPSGWHIPSGSEWKILHEFLGGRTGRKLKSNTGWEKEGNGDNSAGFNALPAGVRALALINKNNGFRWKGVLTIWWSTNKPDNRADVECFVIRDSDKAWLEWHDPWDGYSIRCVKD